MIQQKMKQIAELTKLLLNERELIKIYLRELSENEVQPSEYIQRTQQLLNNTDGMLERRLKELGA